MNCFALLLPAVKMSYRLVRVVGVRGMWKVLVDWE